MTPGEKDCEGRLSVGLSIPLEDALGLGTWIEPHQTSHLTDWGLQSRSTGEMVTPAVEYPGGGGTGRSLLLEFFCVGPIRYNGDVGLFRERWGALSARNESS